MLYVVLIGVPLALAVWLVVLKKSSRLGWLAQLIFLITYVFFMWKGGEGWHIVGADLAWGGWLMAFIASLASSKRMMGQAFLPNRKIVYVPVALWLAASGGVAFIGFTEVIPASSYEGNPVDLGPPLGPGDLFVIEGGTTERMNHHHGVNSQRYAVDFVMLGDLGQRATGMQPTALDAYKAFGTPALSPCRGKILAVANDREDATPPTPDPEPPAGNFVIVHCPKSKVSVMLAHLKKGSVKVKVGQSVKRSLELALIGNSGDSTEPRLHVHVVEGAVSDEKAINYEAEPVPFTLGGRFLIKNDRFPIRTDTR